MGKVSINLLGQIGVITDAQPEEIAPNALTVGNNVRVKNNAVQRRGGFANILGSPSITADGIGIYNSTFGNYVVYAGPSAVYADASGAPINITGPTISGSAAVRHTGGTLNGVYIFNNGVDVPQYWGGNPASTLATLPAWSSGWSAKILRPFKNYLVALNVTKAGANYQYMVKWSSAAEPGTVPASWDEANPANDAGEIDLAETTDPMVDAAPLGDSLIIYKSSSMYAMTYIGGQYIFSFRRIPGNVGMLAAGCCAQTPLGHVVLTPGDVVLNDGQSTRSLVDGRVREYLFSQISSSYYFKCFVVANNAKNEVLICYPANGSSVCNKALVYNYANQACTFIDLPNATCGTAGEFSYASISAWNTDASDWDSDITTWLQSDVALTQSRVILATSAPKIQAMDIGKMDDTASFTATVERTGLIFDDAEAVKLFTAAYPRIQGDAGKTVYFQFGGAMSVGSDYTWSSPTPFVIGTTRKLDGFATGRLLAWRAYSVDAFDWRMTSMDMDVSPQGLF